MPLYITRREPAKRITALYLRVSTNRQETLTQDEQCFRYCDFKKDQHPSFADPETYTDTDVSGSIVFAKRPGAGRLLQAVQRGEIAHIVVAKLDRLGRSAEDVLRVVRICDEHKTTVHFTDLDGDPMSTSGPTGKMLITIMAGFAEFERNRIQERITDRMVSKRNQRTIEGSWGEVCGTIPYGWQPQPTTRTNAKGNPVFELVIHPEENATLRKLIEFRYGEEPGIEGKTILCSVNGRPPSYKTIAQWLNQRRIPAKSGGTWSNGSVAHVLNNTYTRKLINLSSYENDSVAA